MDISVNHMQEQRTLTATEAEVGRVAVDSSAALSAALWATSEAWPDRKSTRLNSSHLARSRMPSSA